MDLEKPAPEPGELIDRRLLAHELEIARRIQQSLLPGTFPNLPGFGISGFCLSAREVGGDFYDVISIAPGKALLVVADVMGKGIPAALFGATLHTLFRSVVEWTWHPAELLKRVNRLIFEDLSKVDMFITVSVALVDTLNDEISIANAGHCPLLLKSLNGSIQAGSAEGVPLGIVPNAIFEQQNLPLDECQCALLYTDGLTEACNPKGELFGQDRLIDWLCGVGTRQRSATELQTNFQQTLDSFTSHSPMRDDRTFLILARHGCGQAPQFDCQTLEGLSKVLVE
jgi:sigma-B regulation protein RsbU (phosphoserine phosphatase)